MDPTIEYSVTGLQKLVVAIVVTLVVVLLAAYLSNEHFSHAARVFISHLFRALF